MAASKHLNNNNYITCNRCGSMLETVEQAVLHSVQCQPPQASAIELPLLAALKAAQIILAERHQQILQAKFVPQHFPPSTLTDNKPSTSQCDDQPVNLTTKNSHLQGASSSKQKLVICKEALDFRPESKRLLAHQQNEPEGMTGDESSSQEDDNDNICGGGGSSSGFGAGNKKERQHVCEFCDKSFHQKRTLVAHRRIHTGEKPYKCPICEAAFTQATHRNGHVKTHDPNFRPYACSICGRCFARKYSLTMHSYIHDGIFPFKCAFCEKKFRQAADMRKHEQRHVVHFSLLCRKCHLKFPSKAALERHTPICSRNVMPNNNNNPNTSNNSNNSTNILP